MHITIIDYRGWEITANKTEQGYFYCSNNYGEPLLDRAPLYTTMNAAVIAEKHEIDLHLND